jgi:predicted nuclease of predicted toxin-antitoxin system
VRILLDECVDQRFRRDLVGHDVATVQESGWAGKKNGELLALAAKSYQVFITVDRNLYFQQNFSAFSIAVLVLAARTNRLADLRPLAKDVLLELSVLKPGQVSLIPKKSS